MGVEFVDNPRAKWMIKKLPITRTSKIKSVIRIIFRIISRFLIIVFIIYLLVILIPKPRAYYELVGGVVPFAIEARDYPLHNYHDYIEPPLLEDGSYDIILDDKIQIESIDLTKKMKYQSNFSLANVQYTYEQFQERLGVDLLESLYVNIRTENNKIGGGFATREDEQDVFVVRLDPTQPTDFDKSYATALITHEFFHIMYFQYGRAGGIADSAPLWFAEGTAVYFAEPSIEYTDGTPFAHYRYFLPAMLEFDHTTTHARTAYMTAGEFVNYIADKYGEDKLIELIFHSQSPDFETEFMRIYGRSVNSMYRYWYFWGTYTGF